MKDTNAKITLPIQGLAHVGIPCGNLDRSVEFYEDLGFRVAARKDALNGYDVAMMKNHQCVIELYQYLSQAPRSKSGRSDGYIDHLALRCEGSLDDCYAAVSAKGYLIVSNGVECSLIWSTPCRYFVLLGPDGERVEISEQ